MEGVMTTPRRKFDREFKLKADKMVVDGVLSRALHANTSTNTLSREKLRNLIQYISRGPLSNERISMTDRGKVRLKLKTKWVDGTSQLSETCRHQI